MNNSYDDLHIDDFLDLIDIKCSRAMQVDKNSIKKDEILISNSITTSALFAERLKEADITSQRSQVVICDTSIFLMLYSFSLIEFRNVAVKKQFETQYTEKLVNCLSEIFDINKNFLYSIIANRRIFYNQWANNDDFFKNYEFIVELELYSDELIIYHEDLPVPLLETDVTTTVFIEFCACVMFYTDNSLKEDNSNHCNQPVSKTEKIVEEPNKTSTKKPKKLTLKYIIIVLIVVFIVILSIINVANTEQNTSDTITQNTTFETIPTTIYYPEMPLPSTGQIIISTNKPRYSKITIHNSSSNCFIKLKDYNLNDVFGFFVRAGDTVTVDVPQGNFYVYFASGNTWYGESHLFGESTQCSKDENIQNFYDYTYEYTLYNVNNGNFNPETIDVDEF